MILKFYYACCIFCFVMFIKSWFQALSLVYQGKIDKARLKKGNFFGTISSIITIVALIVCPGVNIIVSFIYMFMKDEEIIEACEEKYV